MIKLAELSHENQLYTINGVEHRYESEFEATEATATLSDSEVDLWHHRLGQCEKTMNGMNGLRLKRAENLRNESTFAFKIPVYDGKNFLIWESRVKSPLSALNALRVNDVPLSDMTDNDIAADNVARGVIIEHVNNLTVLTLNMFERAYDMFNFLKSRYAERSRDQQADLMSKLYSLRMKDD
ncbi:hypothetical protein V1527DRAFT_453725 [Lipomyces starkeyi]